MKFGSVQVKWCFWGTSKYNSFSKVTNKQINELQLAHFVSRFCPDKYHPFDPKNKNKYVVGDNYLPMWQVPSLKKYFVDGNFSMKESFNTFIRATGKFTILKFLRNLRFCGTNIVFSRTISRISMGQNRRRHQNCDSAQRTFAFANNQTLSVET